MPGIRIEEVLQGLFLIRVDDDLTKYFEGIWEIPEGITYNAYLLKTREEFILFDGCKADFSTEFLDKLSELADPESIPPQDGSGCWTPSPKKLSCASVSMAIPNALVAIINQGATH